MTVQMFLGLLIGFSAISSLFTEGVKKLINDKANYSSNIIVLIISLIVGSIGMCIYYTLNSVVIDTNEVIYIVLMGLATWLVATHGYDKVCQSIQQLFSTKKVESNGE